MQVSKFPIAPDRIYAAKTAWTEFTAARPINDIQRIVYDCLYLFGKRPSTIMFDSQSLARLSETEEAAAFLRAHWCEAFLNPTLLEYSELRKERLLEALQQYFDIPRTVVNDAPVDVLYATSDCITDWRARLAVAENGPYVWFIVTRY